MAISRKTLDYLDGFLAFAPIVLLFLALITQMSLMVFFLLFFGLFCSSILLRIKLKIGASYNSWSEFVIFALLGIGMSLVGHCVETPSESVKERCSLFSVRHDDEISFIAVCPHRAWHFDVGITDSLSKYEHESVVFLCYKKDKFGLVMADTRQIVDKQGNLLYKVPQKD